MRYRAGVWPVFMMLYQSPAGPAYDCPSPWYWTPETPIGPPSVSITSVPSSTYRNDGARLRCFPVWPPGANSTTWPERAAGIDSATLAIAPVRSEEHTSELQSQSNLVCRLLLEKK